MLKKILFGLLALVLLAVIGFFIYINTGRPLPSETNKIVAETIAMESLPELITGKTGTVKSGDIEIWYEKMNPVDTPKGTILLVMGHSATALIWTPNFYQTFIDSGYQVIRYDNRGVGESDWVKDWDKNNPYTLEDMAKDGIAILDAEGIAKAHVIGASMGGMIGQRMALSHEDRLLSYASIMSSGYMNDPDIKQIPKPYIQDFTKLILKHSLRKTEANTLKIAIGTQQMLKGDGNYEYDIKKTAVRTLYEIRNRKGFNPQVRTQHTAAITASGSRFEELGNIRIPTVVIHGVADPLVFVEHSKKYAPMIPNADTLFIDGMGHDIPDLYMKEVHAAIFKNIAKAAE